MTRFCSARGLVIIMILAFAALYLAPLAGHHLIEPDEGRYAEIPREMLESGDYITPMLNYVKYFEKPPMLYWLSALSYKAFGENPFAARFPTAVSALLGIAVTGFLGCHIFGKRAGAISAAVTGTSLLYYAIGTINITDMLLAFFITLTMTAFYVWHTGGGRRWLLIAYAAMALGTLSKGLAAVVLPGAIVLCYIAFTGKWRIIIDQLWLPGLLLFFAISVPWFYLVSRENPDFLRFFFIQEHFQRYTTTMHNRYEPFWFYLPLIPAAVMPWTAFLFALGSKESTLRSPGTQSVKDANIFLLLWFAVILLFFSASGSKLIPYIVPCVPPLAVLMAANADRMLSSERWTGGVLLLSTAIGCVFSLAALVYAYITDYLTAVEGAFTSVGMSAGLLGGLFFAWRYTRRNDYDKTLFSLCAGAVFFLASLQAIYAPLERTRSVWPVAREISAIRRDGEKIAVYDEVLHALPFYTKQRVMLVNYAGELEYGARQKEGDGWFPSSEEFLRQWHNGEPLILVVENKRIPKLFPHGVTGAARAIKAADYTIFFNKEQKL